MSPLQAILHNLHTVDNKIFAPCNFTKSYDMCSNEMFNGEGNLIIIQCYQNVITYIKKGNKLYY